MVINTKSICIYGTGGFARETLACLFDMLQNSGNYIEENIIFMVSDDYYCGSHILNIPVIKQSDFNPNKYEVVVAIGNPHHRKKIVENLPKETKYFSVIHPTAVVSKWVEIGEGCVITAGTIITCNIKIGRHAHLNLHTTIGHDCIIGDYFTTAPSANISGNCSIGECVYFGTNSSVREKVRICDNVTIGMGGIVVKNIEQAGVYIGNPVAKLSK